MDFLCGNRPSSSYAQYKTRGVRGMLMRVLGGLHPGQATRRPALFILEVGAALLSVLAFAM
jgi:hypothetical protein